MAPSSVHLEGTSAAAAAPPAWAEVLPHTPTQLLCHVAPQCREPAFKSGQGPVCSLSPGGPRGSLWSPLGRTVPAVSANLELAREIPTLLRESLVCSHVARQTQKCGGRSLCRNGRDGGLFQILRLGRCFLFSHPGHRFYPVLLDPRSEALVALGEMESEHWVPQVGWRERLSVCYLDLQQPKVPAADVCQNT